MHDSKFHLPRSSKCFNFIWQSLCDFINILSLDTSKLEHNSKQNVNLSMSVLQKIQGCCEDCRIFTTETPGLFVQYVLVRLLQASVFILTGLDTFNLIIWEPTNMISGHCQQLWSARAWQNRREVGNGMRDAWHLFCKQKQISGSV